MAEAEHKTRQAIEGLPEAARKRLDCKVTFLEGEGYDREAVLDAAEETLSTKRPVVIRNY